jgi:hypothetical protein
MIMDTSESDEHDRVSGGEKMHWLAINGLRFSVLSEPMRPWPSVHPTPNLIIGFYSEEVRDRFSLALRCLSDAKELSCFLRKVLPKGVREGLFLVKECEHPEEAVGFDVWVNEAEGEV